MFDPNDILYEDNHILVVNKHCGELVQSDTEGTAGLEDELKTLIKVRDHKPGDAFLGVVHRIDRPVSGAVMFAKTTKALVRLNEMIRNRQITKRYWAVVENVPAETESTLVHFMTRDGNSNRAYCSDTEKPDSKRAELHYRILGRSTNYTLLEVELITGRHHQIRCQLSKIGCPVKGDLKYGAKRSNQGGGISLHSRSIEFIHPVRKEPVRIVAPVPKEDNLWTFFEQSQKAAQ